MALQELAKLRPLHVLLSVCQPAKKVCFSPLYLYFSESLIITAVVLISAKQNVAALNVLHSLIKKGVQGCVLYVSEEYYLEWHEDNYEEFMKKYVVVGGSSIDPVASWRRHNPGNSNHFTFLSDQVY